MSEDVVAEICAHAEEEYPKECCGIVVLLADRKKKVLRCVNTDPEPTKAFQFDASRLLSAEREGRILCVYHSHPDMSAELSIADVVQCEELGYPFFVVSWPDKATQMYEPKGHPFELLGRPFVYGLFDCLSLGRDYYKKHFPEIVFPDTPVTIHGWWENKENENLYLNSLLAAGFVEVKGPLNVHDVILMQFRSEVVNHLSIYLGDCYMMHHVIDRVSGLAVYGGAWEVCTRHILRHKSLL